MTKHPLEIFQLGRQGLEGATEIEFQKARHLLWAAPDLLEALKNIKDVLEDGSCLGDNIQETVEELHDIAWKAIAKAEGGK